MTIADLNILACLDYTQILIFPDTKIEEFIKEYPNIVKYQKKIRNIPVIKEHIDKHKTTMC